MIMYLVEIKTNTQKKRLPSMRIRPDNHTQLTQCLHSMQSHAILIWYLAFWFVIKMGYYIHGSFKREYTLGNIANIKNFRNSYTSNISFKVCIFHMSFWLSMVCMSLSHHLRQGSRHYFLFSY